MLKEVKKLRINLKKSYCKNALNTYFIPDSISSVMLKSSQKLY